MPLFRIEEDEDLPRFDTIKDIPDYGKPTVRKLISKGVIAGNGKKDADGDLMGLNLTDDMVRMLVWNDRLKLYG